MTGLHSDARTPVEVAQRVGLGRRPGPGWPIARTCTIPACVDSRPLAEPEASPSDPVAEPMPLLAGGPWRRSRDRVAGRAGHPVPRLGSAAAVLCQGKPRWARLQGVSLHETWRSPRAHERLEHGCCYLVRPPLALERLTESSHGQLWDTLAPPRTDGAPQGGWTCWRCFRSWARPPGPRGCDITAAWRHTGRGVR